jgi:gamma-glutamyltranspeptidase/glutathione hydrolase
MAHLARRRLVAVGAGATSLALALSGAAVSGLTAGASAAQSSPYYPTKTPTSRGFGGAVTSVDPEASKIGIQVLKHGGNAVDAAVATAAALGVTEPYSAGIGGGGYFVYYNAKNKRVYTIDGRETAPDTMSHDAFIDPETGEPYNFTPERVTSGVSIGVPGTALTWKRAVRLWGRHGFAKALEPAKRLARRGFVVDQTFHDQTADNQERFEAYTTTPKLFLPGGKPPKVGSVFKNPDLARTYRKLQRKGVRWLYHGRLAKEIAVATRKPPVSPDTDLPVPRGTMHKRDLERYTAPVRRPTHVDYRGLDVYGMPPSSSGGSTVGEALNIMEQFRIGKMSAADALHRYLESTALAFADRGAYLGDRKYVDVPLKKLLSDKFAAERACEIRPHKALTKPVAAGDVTSYDGKCGSGARSGKAVSDTENVETTNLAVTDKWGNVVEYTLTIEQTGGSGLLVPNRGFLLNNELTDFSAVYDKADPNRIEPGKRPRSSMSPTIVLKNRKPYLALGSPGGSTIITTVTQLLFNYVDRDMSIVRAMAEPRASQRNTEKVFAEPEFIDKYAARLTPYGHEFQASGDQFTSAAEIGAATAIKFGKRGRLVAVSEPTRRGGGSALVVRHRR